MWRSVDNGNQLSSAIACVSFKSGVFETVLPYPEYWQRFSLSFIVLLKELMEDEKEWADETETEEGEGGYR